MTEMGEFAMYLAVGFTSLGLLFGPIGTAIGRRLSGRRSDAPSQGALDEVHRRMDALESGQHRLAEIEERLDFAERVLARQHESDRLGGGAA